MSFIGLAFGGMTLLLAAIGLYGLLAYTVARRTREIGIRTALGATRRHIVRLVTRQMSWLMAIGLTTGLIAALVLTRLARGYIYISGVEFSDPHVSPRARRYESIPPRRSAPSDSERNRPS